MSAPQLDPAAEIKSLKAELAKMQKKQALSEYHSSLADMDASQLVDALFKCIDNKDYKGLSLALRSGADANATKGSLSGIGNTPLTYAYNDTTTTKILLAHGANPNQRSGLGTLPLMTALNRKDKAAFATLIAEGADADADTGHGRTVVHAAAQSGNVDFLYYARAFNMNARDSRGRTALMIAVESNDSSMVRLAIENGAQLDLRDNTGATPRQRATNAGNTEIAKILKKAAKKQDEKATKSRITSLEQELAEIKSLLAGGKKAKKCCAKAHKKR